MAINLLADNKKKPINLLAEEPISQSFEDLSPEDQEKVMGKSKEQIASQYPGMPQWLQHMILSVTPKDASPNLAAASQGVTDVTGYIPSVVGGALQGASIPIRGAASMIPSEFMHKLANSPDLRELFPHAQGTGQKSVQMASELAGGGGIFGKLMQGVKGVSALAKVPEVLQTPLALGGTGYIATPGTPTEKSIGAGGALALGGAGAVAGKTLGKLGEKVPEFMRGLTNKSTPEALVSAAQQPHDKLQSTADELYGQVRDAIKKREIKIPVKEDHLAKIEEILPKTRATKQLIDRATSGDYEAVHDLQSHLYKKGTKAKASDDIAKENEGEEIIELRDKLNEDTQKKLIKDGHTDIAHLLQQGRKTYATLMDTYFNKNLPKGIGKLVHSEMRLVPENPEKLFSQNSVPMKKFLDQHPDVAKHAQGIREKEAAIKSLNKALIGTGIAGGSITATKFISDLFK